MSDDEWMADSGDEYYEYSMGDDSADEFGQVSERPASPKVRSRAARAGAGSRP